MKTISVEELHAQTGQFVHLAAREDVLVTEHGQPLAVLKRYPDAARVRQRWEEREQKLAALPTMDVDSADYISEDRNGR